MNVHDAEVLVEVWDRLDQMRVDQPSDCHTDGTGYAYLRDQAAKAIHERDVAFDQGRGTWRHQLRAEYRQAVAERDPAALRAALVNVSAAAVSWIAELDSREGGPR